MKQTIRLTESELRGMIEESVRQMIAEGEMEEGFFGNLKAGVQSAFGRGQGSEQAKADRAGKRGGLNLGKRWNAAKEGYKQQGVIDNLDNIKKTLEDLIFKGKLDTNMTLGEFLSDNSQWRKYHQQSLKSLRTGAVSAASSAQNDIYR